MSVVTRATPEVMAEAAALAISDGYGFIKVKLGQGLATDGAVLAAVRKAVGSGYYLCADANGAYCADDLSKLGAMARDVGLAFIEDPCRLPPVSAAAKAAQTVGCQVVADRFCENRDDAEAFCEHGLTWLAAKPGRLGRTEAEEIARLSALNGGLVVFGLFGEGAAGTVTLISSAAMMQGDTGTVIAAETGFHEGFAFDFLRTGPRLSNGAHVIDAPALHLAGLVDWPALRAAATAHVVLEAA